MPDSNVAIEPISGYFVVLDEEERKELSKSMKLTSSRGGIFYQKDDLISLLGANKALVGKEMHIVEVNVPQQSIINPNCKKFGIRCGQGVAITNIEPFTAQWKISN